MIPNLDSWKARANRAGAIGMLTVVGVCGAWVSDASAACFAPPSAAGPAARASLLNSAKAAFASGAPGVAQNDRSSQSDRIVGMWFVTYKLADGAIWDEGFQHYHADNTELSVDNAVPPALGNVCIGVWKADGPGIVKLRHYTFNWTADGQKAGIFQLLTTVQVLPGGQGYLGTFLSDSFDLDGKVIPELHAEGTVEAVRITVD